MYPSFYIKDWNRSYLHFHKNYGHHTWQIGELSWLTTTNKATWLWDYVATLSHVTNKKQYISTSSRPMTAKLAKVEIYRKGPPSIKSFDALNTWSSDHGTDKKRYISTSARPMATKRDRVVAINAGLLSTTWHNLLMI